MADELITVKEAAQLMKSSERTIFRWMQLGRIKAFRLPSGIARFSRSGLLRAMENYEFGGDPKKDKNAWMG